MDEDYLLSHAQSKYHVVAVGFDLEATLPPRPPWCETIEDFEKCVYGCSARRDFEAWEPLRRRTTAASVQEIIATRPTRSAAYGDELDTGTTGNDYTLEYI